MIINNWIEIDSEQYSWDSHYDTDKYLFTKIMNGDEHFYFKINKEKVVISGYRLIESFSEDDWMECEEDPFIYERSKWDMVERLFNL